jgi:MFS family permease
LRAVAAENRRRWMALYVLCVGMLMIVLDATIVNVALPTIQDDLGFAQNDLAWVVNAYLIAFGGLLLLAGRIGDLIGQRRIFLIGPDSNRRPPGCDPTRSAPRCGRFAGMFGA